MFVVSFVKVAYNVSGLCAEGVLKPLQFGLSIKLVKSRTVAPCTTAPFAQNPCYVPSLTDLRRLVASNAFWQLPAEACQLPVKLLAYLDDYSSFLPGRLTHYELSHLYLSNALQSFLE